MGSHPGGPRRAPAKFLRQCSELTDLSLTREKWAQGSAVSQRGLWGRGHLALPGSNVPAGLALAGAGMREQLPRRGMTQPPLPSLWSGQWASALGPGRFPPALPLGSLPPPTPPRPVLSAPADATCQGTTQRTLSPPPSPESPGQGAESSARQGRGSEPPSHHSLLLQPLQAPPLLCHCRPFPQSPFPGASPATPVGWACPLGWPLGPCREAGQRPAHGPLPTLRTPRSPCLLRSPFLPTDPSKLSPWSHSPSTHTHTAYSQGPSLLGVLAPARPAGAQ